MSGVFLWNPENVLENFNVHYHNQNFILPRPCRRSPTSVDLNLILKYQILAVDVEFSVDIDIDVDADGVGVGVGVGVGEGAGVDDDAQYIYWQ